MPEAYIRAGVNKNRESVIVTDFDPNSVISGGTDMDYINYILAFEHTESPTRRRNLVTYESLKCSAGFPYSGASNIYIDQTHAYNNITEENTNWSLQKAIEVLDGSSDYVCMDDASEFSVISGGTDNCIYNSSWAIIGSGDENYINTADYSGIVGGQTNYLASGEHSFIGGGENNYIQGADHSVILGGEEGIAENEGEIVKTASTIPSYGNVQFSEYQTSIVTYDTNNHSMTLNDGNYIKIPKTSSDGIAKDMCSLTGNITLTATYTGDQLGSRTIVSNYIFAAVYDNTIVEYATDLEHISVSPNVTEVTTGDSPSFTIDDFYITTSGDDLLLEVMSDSVGQVVWTAHIQANRMVTNYIVE